MKHKRNSMTTCSKSFGREEFHFSTKKKSYLRVTPWLNTRQQRWSCSIRRWCPVRRSAHYVHTVKRNFRSADEKCCLNSSTLSKRTALAKVPFVFYFPQLQSNWSVQNQDAIKSCVRQQWQTSSARSATCGWSSR